MDTPRRPPPTVPYDYLKNLEKLGADAASSDYTIACCGSEFKVHKQVVSLHSEYFARLFKSQYKESSTNRIDLVEDPKAAVECMVQYFYKFDYATARIAATDSMDPDVVLNNIVFPETTPSPDTQLSSDLQSHADIYTLADKYDIPGLKTLAKTKFESLACLLAASASRSAHLLADFVKVIPFVYTHTAPNEEGLRSSIVKAWRQAPEAISATLGDKRLRELVEKFPELGLDLVKGLLTQADVRALAREDEDRDEDEEDLRDRRAAREARRLARAAANHWANMPSPEGAFEQGVFTSLSSSRRTDNTILDPSLGNTATASRRPLGAARLDMYGYSPTLRSQAPRHFSSLFATGNQTGGGNTS